jgi:hypothetical protein
LKTGDSVNSQTPPSIVLLANAENGKLLFPHHGKLFLRYPLGKITMETLRKDMKQWERCEAMKKHPKAPLTLQA